MQGCFCSLPLCRWLMQQTLWPIPSPYSMPMVSGPAVGTRAFILTSILRLKVTLLMTKKMRQELLGRKRIAVRLRRLILLSTLDATDVMDAWWNKETEKWHVTIENLETKEKFEDRCDVFVNAGGILNAWRWPAIPGLQTFKGPLVHSAAWDQNLDLKGKHVRLIENGRVSHLVHLTALESYTDECRSSGIQILPAILPEVAKLTTFIREPTWVAVGGFAGFKPRKFTEQEIYDFKHSTDKLGTYRHWLEHNAK
jgi:hypothetical protein